MMEFITHFSDDHIIWIVCKYGELKSISLVMQAKLMRRCLINQMINIVSLYRITSLINFYVYTSTGGIKWSPLTVLLYCKWNSSVFSLQVNLVCGEAEVSHPGPRCGSRYIYIYIIPIHTYTHTHISYSHNSRST